MLDPEVRGYRQARIKGQGLGICNILSVAMGSVLSSYGFAVCDVAAGDRETDDAGFPSKHEVSPEKDHSISD